MRKRRSRDEESRPKQFLRYTGPLMTLANMRANEVRALAIYCEHCHHGAVLSVDDFADDVPVPAFGPRMVCTVCGAIGADARPNWNERPAIGAFIRRALD
jgi:hypothetical protein